MGPTTELSCPTCEAETTHRLVARTTLHLGTKCKWECTACDHRLVTIDDAIVGGSAEQP